MFLTFISEIVYLFTRHSKFTKQYISPYSFYATTFGIGALLGCATIGLSKSELMEFKSLFMSAAVMAGSIFVCVSIFSILTVRRVMIYLGAIIGSLVLSIISIFMYKASFEAAIIGLVLGTLYVVIDTQLMIHKAENGVFEPYEDARQLFLDLVKLTIEIIKILGKEKKKE